MNEKLRPALAELLGTFLLLFIGAGSIITDNFTHGAVGLIGVALAQGLTLAVMVSALGPISGGHFNPAVTLGLWMAKKVSKPTAFFYIAAQLLGAVLAGLALRLIFEPSSWQRVHLGAPALALFMSPMAGIVVEFILTMALMIAYLGTAIDAMAPKIGGFGIGLTVVANILIGGPLTGAAMNPARAFGPGLISGFWEYQWIYWIGPIAGAAFASWLYTRHLSKTI